MEEYYNLFEIIDRQSFLSSLYINEDLAYLDFKNLPPHIRKMLYDYYPKIKDKEIEF